jgi:hypothetical protein
MKSAKFTLILLLLAGCSHKPAPPSPTGTEQHLIKLCSEWSGETVAKLVCQTATGLTNRHEFSTALYAAVWEKSVEMLMHDTPSQLKKKLDSLERGTQRHPYTAEMINEALRRKPLGPPINRWTKTIY